MDLEWINRKILILQQYKGASCAPFIILKNRFHYVLSLPSPARALDKDAAVGLRAGEAMAPTVELGGGLDVILGVTTAGDPGPRSIRLSSVASVNIWKEESKWNILVNYKYKTMQLCSICDTK